MGDVYTVPAGIRELEHLHARKAAVRKELLLFRSHIAQILGDHGHITELLPDGIKECHPRPLVHLAVERIRISIRDRIVFRKSVEMIDADHIIKFIIALDPADPPGKITFFLGRPVIDGIAPELTGRGKRIRRTAGNNGRRQVFIHQEGFGVCPDIRRIERRVKWQVADDPNALLSRVSMQLVPLLIKLELTELIGRDLGCKTLLRLRERLFTALLQRLVPLKERLPALFVLDRHEQCVVLEPETLFSAVVLKALFLVQALFQKALMCLFQERKTVLIELAVIHPKLIAPEIGGVQFVPGKQPFLGECLQTDKVRIARERGERLIRGITEARRPDRQDLPVALTRYRQKIDKSIRRPRK